MVKRDIRALNIVDMNGVVKTLVNYCKPLDRYLSNVDFAEYCALHKAPHRQAVRCYGRCK
jgi:hypothetical protein